jgi:GGDEF domain-containing protein
LNEGSLQVTHPRDVVVARAYDSLWVSLTAEPSLRVALGSREQLLADLQEAMRPGAGRSVLLIVGLTGFQDFVDRRTWLEGEALLDALSTRLGEAVGGSARCYRARRDEFALLCDPEGVPLPPLVERVTAALAEPEGPIPVAAVFGTVVVPDETSHPLAAIQLADERLTASHPGRPPRERRRYLRPGSRGRDAGAASSVVLEAELTSAARIRRAERLLDIAETLTKLADAARIEDAGAGRLQGQAAGADRIPLLLKELALKLAALKALDGTEIGEANALLASPVTSTMRSKVLGVLDEIGETLADA